MQELQPSLVFVSHLQDTLPLHAEVLLNHPNQHPPPLKHLILLILLCLGHQELPSEKRRSRPCPQHAYNLDQRKERQGQTGRASERGRSFEQAVPTASCGRGFRRLNTHFATPFLPGGQTRLASCRLWEPVWKGRQVEAQTPVTNTDFGGTYR